LDKFRISGSSAGRNRASLIELANFETSPLAPMTTKIAVGDDGRMELLFRAKQRFLFFVEKARSHARKLTVM
jgi:hypothetical protein